MLQEIGVSLYESDAIDLLLGCFNYCNLSQMNTLFKSYDGMLDLIFSSDSNVVVDLVIDPLIVPDAYHPPLYTIFKGLVTSTGSVADNFAYRDFKQADYSGVREYLNAIDCDSETGNIYPGIALDCLYGHVNTAINAFVQVRSVFRSTYPKWFSPELKHLIRVKKRAHKGYKQSGAHSDYLNFSALRAQCKVFLNRDHRAYIESVENSLLDDVTGFWRFVNSKRGGHVIPSNMVLEITTTSTSSAVADLFA